MYLISVTLASFLWFFIGIFSFAFSDKKRYKKPKLTLLSFYLLICLEAVVISLAIRNGRDDNVFTIVPGIILLIIGWAISNMRTIQFLNKKLAGSQHIYNGFIKVLGENPIDIYPAILGDWVQILGFALIWNSSYSIILSILCILLYALFAPTILIKRTENLRLQSQISFNKRLIFLFAFFVRIILISLLPFLLIELFLRDRYIFWGNSDDATQLLNTLLQVEVTLGALVVTVLFLLVEYSNSTYSPRLTRVLSRRPAFRIMTLISGISVAGKIFLITNTKYLQLISINNGYSFQLDLALVLTVISGFAFIYFAIDAFSMLSPEAVLFESLKELDKNWITTVNQEWSSNHGPGNVHINRDPMILVERILISTLNQGDLNTFLVALIILRDRFTDVLDNHDCPGLDWYLSERLQTVIQVAGERHSEVALINICDYFNDTTTPSKQTLIVMDIKSFDIPIGTRLLRIIADQAIKNHYIDLAAKVAFLLRERGKSAVKCLPKYSEIWLVNPDNHNENLSIEDQSHYHKYDMKLENYILGYLDYFSKQAVRAAEIKNPDITSIFTYCIIDQIGEILLVIKEEPYQRYLTLRALWALEKIVQTVCKNKLANVSSFTQFGFRIEGIVNKSVALNISNFISYCLISTAKAGILDYSMVIDSAVTTTHLAPNNPEIVITVIDAFGKAGVFLSEQKNSSDREGLTFLINEIMRRITQIENYGYHTGFKTKVRRAASTARAKIKSFEKLDNKDQGK